MSFWEELKRRNVYKVGIAYLIVAWLIVQAAAIVFPHLNLPSWAVTLIIVILIIGFPLILLFAWAFEITPDGLKWTKEVPHHESITHLTGKKLNYILAGLLVIAVGYILVDKLYIAKRTTQPEQVSVSGEAKTKKTIAVLPFIDLSPEKDQEYFVDGLSEELLNSLAQIPDLTVIARTSSFTFKGSNKKVQEIANELGVENILEGSVRKAGTALRITAQLVKAVDGSHLWSKTYDRELKDIFAVQEDIATAVAAGLKVTLGIGTSSKQLGGTDNEKAYELYLVAQGQNDNSQALKSIDAAIALDPEFALAWVEKASVQNFIAKDASLNSAALEQDAALRSVQRAIELEPNLGVAYATLGSIKSSKGEYLEAGSAYRKAYELTTEPLWNIREYANHLLQVGYLEKAYELTEASWRSDPLNQQIRSLEIAIFGRLGDLQRAEEEYERARISYGDDFMNNMHMTLARLGSGGVVSRDDIVISQPIHDEVKKHLDSPKVGLAVLRRFYTDDNYQDGPSLISIWIWASYFGDPEFAMDSMEKVISTNASGIDNIWFPVMKEVRQLPRFKALVRDIGLVDYWNKFGWPDICHQLDNGDFECD